MTCLRPLLAAAALSLSLVACSSVASSGDGRQADTVADGSTFALAPGAMVTLADASTLRYERVVNDSRCQPDVQCVWAGDAELAFAWRSRSGATEQFSLHTGKGDKTRALGERTLVLVSVARGTAPEAQLRIDP